MGFHSSQAMTFILHSMQCSNGAVRTATVKSECHEPAEIHGTLIHGTLIRVGIRVPYNLG